MKLVDDAFYHIVFMLGVAIGQFCVRPCEKVGGAETVIILETDDAGIHRRVELQGERLSLLAPGNLYAWEDGLLVASRITVITIGKGCLLVEGIEHGAQWQCGVIGHLVERETVTVDIQWSDRCYDV